MSAGWKNIDRVLLGALIGAAIGIVVIRGTKGAIIGAIAGFVVQHRVLRAKPRAATSTPPDDERRARLLRLADSYPPLAAAVARVDGEFDAAARAAARSWFARDLRADAATLDRVDAALDRTARGSSHAPESGSAPDSPRAAAKELQRVSSPKRRERLEVLFALFRVALLRALGTARERALRDAATGLDLSREDYEELRAEFVVHANGAATEADYRALDLAPGAPLDAVRESYREAVKTYHPDRFAHLGPEFADVAAEKFKTIQGAYERITADAEAPSPRRPLATRCPNCRKFTAADERDCIRCGHRKIADAGRGRSRPVLRCAFCREENDLPDASARAAVTCRNCRVIVAR